MLDSDKFEKLLDEMKDYFTYLPMAPNIVIVLQSFSQYTTHKADLVNTIYPVMKELNPDFDKSKYEEVTNSAYFDKIDILFNEERNFEDLLDGMRKYYNTINSRVNYLHSLLDANKEELTKDLSFIVDLMELTYSAARYLHTYAFSLFEYQVYIDKELDYTRHYEELEDFVGYGVYVINYMFKRTFMYTKGEILYGKELADEYIKDMYTGMNNEKKMIFKEVLSFCFEKNYIPEEIHNDILDIFQSIDNSSEEVVYN